MKLYGAEREKRIGGRRDYILFISSNLREIQDRGKVRGAIPWKQKSFRRHLKPPLVAVDGSGKTVAAAE